MSSPSRDPPFRRPRALTLTFSSSVLDIVIFTVLGSVMPFQTWGVSASKSPLAFSTLAGLAVAIHLFRRLPTVLAFSPGLKSLDSWGKTLCVSQLFRRSSAQPQWR